MKRSVIIKFKDGTEKELVLSKATAMHMAAGMIHLNKLSDGTWRLIFSDDVVKDFSTVESLHIHRED